MSWDLMNPRLASILNPALTNLENLMNIPMLGGVQLTGIVLVANTPKQIPHKLGIVPTGWIISDLNADSVVWRTAWTNQVITIESSANTTVSIWVY
jgi:hypothetical protein